MTRILFTKVHWREVKEKFRDEIFVCFSRVTFRGIDHHEGSGLGEICGLCPESPSCVVSAERDMLVAVTTDWGITQAPHDAGQPPATRRCQPTLSVPGPTNWPVRSFLPVPTGLSISLGNSAHSLLLPASGELDLHNLTSNLSLICKTSLHFINIHRRPHPWYGQL